MKSLQRVRLKEKEIKAIKDIIQSFDKEARVYIYGSRADLSKKGGDIDILVVSSKISLEQELKIKAKLLVALGDRKIDLVVSKSPTENTFTDLIYSQAVEI